MSTRTPRQKIIYDVRKGKLTTAQIAAKHGVTRAYVSSVRGALRSNDNPNGGAQERIPERRFEDGFPAVAVFGPGRPRLRGFRFYKIDTRDVTPDGVTIYEAVQLP